MLFFVFFSCTEEKQTNKQHQDNFVQGEVVRITSPSNGDIVQPHLEISFEAGEQIQGLVLYANDVAIAEMTEINDDNFKVSLEDGTIDLRLDGINIEGDVASEHQIRVVVENESEDNPWTAIVSPQDGATVTNPVHILVNASALVEDIELFADDFSLGTTEANSIFSYEFSGTGFPREIEAIGYIDGEEVSNDTITITVQPDSNPIESDINAMVIDMLETYPTDGSFEYYWPQSGGWIGNPSDIYYTNQLYAEGDDLNRSYCVGLTFEVFMRTMEEVDTLNNGDGTINGISINELDEFRLDWYVRDLYGSGAVEAVENYGIGERVSSWDEIQSGDFLQFWRHSGSGHNTIFIDWEYDIDDNIIGFVYWSTQGSTNGVGYNSEYFGTSGSYVDPNYFFAARVYPAEEWLGW